MPKLMPPSARGLTLMEAEGERSRWRLRRLAGSGEGISGIREESMLVLDR